ncbi:MAG: phage integrase N-terminal SAM-like domain-containing protein [Acidobacteria bacterium]|nr:phage integrase N-terminal SAM-like domain-containing protein [Acidobacteriota bacterium]
MSPPGQEAYVHAVRQLAAHFHLSPDRITEDQLREYFLHLTHVKKFAAASFTIVLCGIKFFFVRTLQRDWKPLDLVRPARPKKLPVVFSREEVHRILHGVRLPVYRACLATIYSCGLRLLEGARLRSPTWTAAGCSFTSTAREAVTATSPRPTGPWRPSASTGAPITRPSGCSPWRVTS